ncbi:hypothetical protein F4604DRAFT_1025282 [Suillus subluteus]|nr:hypothetical protein F4604DRAFT_1025282 [Suillus subluteus]
MEDFPFFGTHFIQILNFKGVRLACSALLLAHLGFSANSWPICCQFFSFANYLPVSFLMIAILHLEYGHTLRTSVSSHHSQSCASLHVMALFIIDHGIHGPTP